MSLPQLLGVLRAILAALGGWAAANGYIEGDQIEPVIGAALVIAAAVWSWAEKRRRTGERPQ